MKKYKNYIAAFVLTFLLGTGIASAQSFSFDLWRLVGNLVEPNTPGVDIYAPDNLRFDGEIQPDGSTCASGEVLQRTGANNWDCVSVASISYWVDASGSLYPKDGDYVEAPYFNATSTTATSTFSGFLDFANMPFVNNVDIQDTFVDVSGDTMTGKLNLNAGLSSSVGSTNVPWSYYMSVPFFGIYTGESRNYEMLSTLTQIVAFDYQRTGSTPQASTLFQTSGWKTLLSQGSSGDLLQVKPSGYNVEVSDSATTVNLYSGLLGGNPTKANFIKMSTGDGVKFKVDSFGNMLPAGAYLHPRGTIGAYENLITYSNTFTDASWVAGSGAIVTDGAVNAPDGKPNNAATIVWGTGTKIIKKTVTGETAANNTFTVQGWAKRTGGDSVLRVALTDSTESETSTVESVGFNTEIGQWIFFSFSYTYSGTATGAPVIKLYYTSTTSMTNEVFGFQVTSGTNVLGYAPTQNYTVSRRYGALVNGSFRLASGNGATHAEIIKSANQGTTDLLHLSDETESKQIFVDSNFNINLLDNLKTVYGTGKNSSILYDGTDMVFNSQLNGTGDFVFQGGNVGIGTTTPYRKLSITDAMNIEPRATAPTSPIIGDIYVDSDTNEFCFYDGSVWTGLKAAGACI